MLPRLADLLGPAAGLGLTVAGYDVGMQRHRRGIGGKGVNARRVSQSALLR